MADLLFAPPTFRAPVGRSIGFPSVDAPACKTEGFETHDFQRYVTGEDNQITPADRCAVLLFDRPKHAPCFDVAVVPRRLIGAKRCIA